MTHTSALRVHFLAAALVAAASAASRAEDHRALIDVYKSRAEVISAEAQNKQANAAIITAWGAYTKSRAEAAKLNQETREKDLQNDLLETKVYYDKRGMYHAYKAAHKRPQSTPEQIALRARIAAPERLSQHQLWIKPGYVRWPSMLLQRDFADERNEIDLLLAQRTPSDSGAGSQNCVELQRSIDMMKCVLHGKIRSYKSTDYLAARKFLESLAIEVQHPVDAGGATQLAAY